MIELFKKKKQPMLSELAKQVAETQKQYDTLLKEFDAFKKEMAKAITKIGIVRFNPFQETGSDQSFSIALLDDHHNGFVLTSHYLKEYNRMYGKPVREGKSEYHLSEEEKEAVAKAIQS